VQDVSFSLEEGTDMALIGPNGAGKSTLIQAILGILPRQSGEVYFLGQPLHSANQLASRLLQQIAYSAAELLFDRRIPDYGGRTVVGMGSFRFQLPWAGRRKRRPRRSRSAGKSGRNSSQTSTD